jgi:hypothetical protein
MFANVYSADVLIDYQAMGIGQVMGAAADVASILIALFVVLVSIVSLGPGLWPRA